MKHFTPAKLGNSRVVHALHVAGALTGAAVGGCRGNDTVICDDASTEVTCKRCLRAMSSWIGLEASEPDAATARELLGGHSVPCVAQATAVVVDNGADYTADGETRRETAIRWMSEGDIECTCALGTAAAEHDAPTHARVEPARNDAMVQRHKARFHAADGSCTAYGDDCAVRRDETTERRELHVMSRATRLLYVFEGLQGTVIYLRGMSGQLTRNTVSRFCEVFQAVCVHGYGQRDSCPGCDAEEESAAAETMIAAELWEQAKQDGPLWPDVLLQQRDDAERQLQHLRERLSFAVGYWSRTGTIPVHVIENAMNESRQR